MHNAHNPKKKLYAIKTTIYTLQVFIFQDACNCTVETL